MHSRSQLKIPIIILKSFEKAHKTGLALVFFIKKKFCPDLHKGLYTRNTKHVSNTKIKSKLNQKLNRARCVAKYIANTAHVRRR